MADTPRGARSNPDSSPRETDGRTQERFESLRKRAKQWHRALRDGDRAALERLEAALPRHADPPVLREVQQALARERGFASWAELKEHCALAAAAGAGPGALLDVFLEHACIFTPPTDFASKWRRAERIRARHPEIATASLHAAVVCGEVEAVRASLEDDPGALDRKGGPQQWEPILFACYGRLPDERARARSLEVAELLLGAGADPNAFFASPDAWRLRFTALTGVLGQGEMGQPEHPHADALARLLLARGARANDGQALYNTHLVGDDVRWLELLLAHGLGPGDPITWHVDPADAAKSGADRCPSILDYLATAAAKNGHVRRLALLLEHGASPDARSIYDGKSCYELARTSGGPEALALLRRHGATEIALGDHDAFVAAVRTGTRDEAEALVHNHPEFRALADPLIEAARRGEHEIVRRFLELGVDPNSEGEHGHRALHVACEHEDVARLLLEHGADPRARVFGGTPCGWARTGGNLAMARFHAERSRSLLDAAASGHVPLARELLASEPACLDERTPGGDGPLHELCTDAALAEPLIALLLDHGADPDLVNDAGQTPAQRLDALGADEVADLLEAIRS